MASPTYDKIASIVLDSSASSVTFDDIPTTDANSNSYKDLIVAINPVNVSAGGRTRLRINADTSSSYTRVRMYNSGSTPTSNSTTQAFIELGYQDSGADFMERHQFFDIDATDKHKTIISRGDVVEGTDLVIAAAHRWADTSAINKIEIYRDTGTFGVNSTFDLYAIAG